MWTRLWLVLQRALVRRERRDRDIDDEIRFHLEQEARLRVERGASPARARREALLAFGSLSLAKETTRSVWVSTRLEQLAQDLRLGGRILVTSPGVSATGGAAPDAGDRWQHHGVLHCQRHSAETGARCAERSAGHAQLDSTRRLRRAGEQLRQLRRSRRTDHGVAPPDCLSSLRPARTGARPRDAGRQWHAHLRQLFRGLWRRPDQRAHLYTR
jgi:hypothetical protein